MDEFYNEKLSTITDSLVAGCNEPSPALFAVGANMMCQAAGEAVRKFSVDPTTRNVTRWQNFTGQTATRETGETFADAVEDRADSAIPARSSLANVSKKY